MADASLRASGIYIIRNTVNGKVYVGSAKSLHRRLSEHRRKLERGDHENDRLQQAFTKYGKAAFDFVVLEHVEERAARLAREQHWIDFYKCAERTIGYNIYPIAGSPAGTKHTEAARAKMRAAAKTKPPISDETRARISKARTGIKKTPEQIEKHRQALIGYRHSDETKAKVSLAGKGRKHSPESIEKRAAAHRGTKRSDEARAKMAESARRRGPPLAALAAQAAARAAGVVSRHTDETKAKMSETRRAWWAARKLLQQGTK